MKKKRFKVAKIVAGILCGIVLIIAMSAGVGYYIFKSSFFDQSNYIPKTVQAAQNTASARTAEMVKKSEGEANAGKADVSASDTKSMASSETCELPDTGTYNLLLLGVDRRDESWDGNSDTMILLTLNYDKKTIFLTSFLRDLYADIPGIGVRKLNAACANGGADLCVDTLVSNYQVEIDNYAMVDFNGMIDIVDALGGIDLEIDDDERVTANDYVLTMCEANGDDPEEHQIESAGYVHLDGYQAVGYSRNRFTGGKSDFGRTERQRKVLMKIFEKAQDSSFMTITHVVKKIMPYVTHNIDEKTMLTKLAEVPGLLDWDVEEIHIPYDGEYHSENEILYPDDMDDTIHKLCGELYGK